MSAWQVVTWVALAIAAAAQVWITVNLRRKRRLLQRLRWGRVVVARRVESEVLAGEIAQGRQVYAQQTGSVPGVLAIGRWDARELAYFAARNTYPETTPLEFFRQARAGVFAFGAQVKVDGRIGRMPRALWWHP